MSGLSVTLPNTMAAPVCELQLALSKVRDRCRLARFLLAELAKGGRCGEGQAPHKSRLLQRLAKLTGE